MIGVMSLLPLIYYIDCVQQLAKFEVSCKSIWCNMGVSTQGFAQGGYTYALNSPMDMEHEFTTLAHGVLVMAQ